MSFKITDIYRPSLALLTDLYQLTMSQGYFEEGIHEREAMFQMSFRQNPFNGGFAIACGIEAFNDFLENASWQADDLAYLESLTSDDGSRLFKAEFLEYLSTSRLKVSVDAVDEGRVVFAHEPLARVRGPLAQCQLLETPMLNFLNFPTLIATKAARVCLAAGSDPVLEFGLRRAQGIDGALTASRAAYVGGVAATSNLMAGRYFGIPVRGTHAHSWVMSFDTELESFMAFARSLPRHSVFLVDTFNTMDGIENAIKAGQWLVSQGGRLAGIRIDSGDLAYLSRAARKRLDEAGFKDAVIVASNDLDEHLILSLKSQGAAIGIWGVGTKLVTGSDDPALGGVYKMVALRSQKTGQWDYKIKLSEQISKITTPGMQQVRRYRDGRRFLGDMIFDELDTGKLAQRTIVDPLDMTRRKQIPATAEYEDLLRPVYDQGHRVASAQGIDKARANVRRDLDFLHEGIKRATFPHTYPVGLEPGLFDRKAAMILKIRGFSQEDSPGV
jgi:nicotinate phosphoribosyltransferase